MFTDTVYILISGTNTQTISEVGSGKTDDSEVASDPKTFGSLEIERELRVGVKDKDKSDDGYELNVFKSEAVGDEAHDEGSDESEVISSEKFEKSIDVDDETVEKGEFIQLLFLIVINILVILIHIAVDFYEFDGESPSQDLLMFQLLCKKILWQLKHPLMFLLRLRTMLLLLNLCCQNMVVLIAIV
jgi:hypothetical protein